ncbi:hypothetical protein BK640_23075 [Pseudomonas protegens]|nr:hypothetical protein BK639_15545 [Pseudomonas protegens]ROL97221.1 hypothetical protein BK640_23075 [Pseudomonas protegens]ROM00105.1 hypothetical protein BK641_25505 [Pseudomonas protegens]ROM11145.1 hypothetical protein BK642_06790 [Pseudomonas protegens]
MDIKRSPLFAQLVAQDSRVKGGIMHYMNTSSYACYDITIQQGLSPVHKAINLINDRREH